MRLFDQAVEFLTQPAQDPRLGLVDGRDTHPQINRDPGR